MSFRVINCYVLLTFLALSSESISVCTSRLVDSACPHQTSSFVEAKPIHASRNALLQQASFALECQGRKLHTKPWASFPQGTKRLAILANSINSEIFNYRVGFKPPESNLLSHEGLRRTGITFKSQRYVAPTCHARAKKSAKGSPGIQTSQ